MWRVKKATKMAINVLNESFDQRPHANALQRNCMTQRAGIC